MDRVGPTILLHGQLQQPFSIKRDENGQLNFAFQVPWILQSLDQDSGSSSITPPAPHFKLLSGRTSVVGTSDWNLYIDRFS